MPMVDGKKYAYTPAGKAAAKKAKEMNKAKRVTGRAKAKK